MSSCPLRRRYEPTEPGQATVTRVAATSARPWLARFAHEKSAGISAVQNERGVRPSRTRCGALSARAVWHHVPRPAALNGEVGSTRMVGNPGVI